MMYMQAPVAASVGSGDVGRPPVGRLEAVAVVEPLGRGGVADRSRVLDSVVGIQELGADDPDVGPRVVAYWRHASQSRRGTTSELSSTTSWRGSVARSPRLTLVAKPAFCSPATTSIPSIRRSAARCSGPLASSATTIRTRSRSVVWRIFADQLRHQLRVPVAGDHDRHRTAVAPIPAPRGDGVAARAGTEPQHPVQRRQPQREDQRLEQDRRDPPVLVGEIGAPRQVGQAVRAASRPAPSAPRSAAQLPVGAGAGA